MSALRSRYRPALSPYSPERYRPYRALLAKVIMRAAYDYALWRDSKDVRLRNYAKDAERWLFEDSTLLNGLLSICEILSVDPHKIRRYARALTRDQVKKLEFMEREGRDPIQAVLGPGDDDELEACGDGR